MTTKVVLSSILHDIDVYIFKITARKFKTHIVSQRNTTTKKRKEKRKRKSHWHNALSSCSNILVLWHDTNVRKCFYSFKNNSNSFLFYRGMISDRHNLTLCIFYTLVISLLYSNNHTCMIFCISFQRSFHLSVRSPSLSSFSKSFLAAAFSASLKTS